MAIDTQDKLIAALGQRTARQGYFPSYTTAAGRFTLMNRGAGTGASWGQFSGGADASVGGSIITKNDPGFPPISDAGLGKQNHLLSMSYGSSIGGSVFPVDILYSASGFVGNVTTPQLVNNPPALSRRASGDGVQIWALGLTALGATASNITVTYTNQDGVPGRTTVPRAIASLAAVMFLDLPLAAGDTGAREITQVQLSASTGTAGNFAVMLVDVLSTPLTVAANDPIAADFAGIGMPPLEDGAATGFAHVGTSTSSGIGVITLKVGAA